MIFFILTFSLQFFSYFCCFIKLLLLLLIFPFAKVFCFFYSPFTRLCERVCVFDVMSVYCHHGIKCTCINFSFFCRSLETFFSKRTYSNLGERKKNSWKAKAEPAYAQAKRHTKNDINNQTKYNKNFPFAHEIIIFLIVLIYLKLLSLWFPFFSSCCSIVVELEIGGKFVLSQQYDILNTFLASLQGKCARGALYVCSQMKNAMMRMHFDSISILAGDSLQQPNILRVKL